jgi:hypothetical protein
MRKFLIFFNNTARAGGWVFWLFPFDGGGSQALGLTGSMVFSDF